MLESYYTIITNYKNFGKFFSFKQMNITNIAELY